MTPEDEALAGLKALLRPIVAAVVSEELARRELGPRRDALSTAEVARAAGVTVATVTDWIRRHTLPASKPPGAKGWVVQRNDLEAFLRGQAVPVPVDLADRRRERAAALAAAARGAPDAR